MPTTAVAGQSGEVVNPGANVANYGGGAIWNGMFGNVISIGTAGASSFAGMADAAGNVAEWTEALEGSQRVSRGGSFQDVAADISIDARPTLDPFNESAGQGFRLATEFVDPTLPGTYDVTMRNRGKLTCPLPIVDSIARVVIRRSSSAVYIDLAASYERIPNGMLVD